MTMIAAHIIHPLAWFSFGLGHSLLAGTRAKDLLASVLDPWYRFAYSGLAGVHLLAGWLVGNWLLGGAAPFALSDAARAGLYGLSILGLVILLLAMRGYDLGRFAGTTQIGNYRRGTAEPEDEPLHTDGFRAWVRPVAGFTGNHIAAVRGDVAFDYHGWSDWPALLAHMAAKAGRWWPGWDCTLVDLPADVLVSEAKSLTYEGPHLREPGQFLHDALPRARAFLDRFPGPPS